MCFIDIMASDSGVNCISFILKFHTFSKDFNTAKPFFLYLINPRTSMKTILRLKASRPNYTGLLIKKGILFDFLLRAKRDAKAASLFFKKVLKASYIEIPRAIHVDKALFYPVL
jgi:hypothetical protein